MTLILVSGEEMGRDGVHKGRCLQVNFLILLEV
jgi:hypothetical protein